MDQYIYSKNKNNQKNIHFNLVIGSYSGDGEVEQNFVTF